MTMLKWAMRALDSTDVDWSSDGRSGPKAEDTLKRQVVRAVVVAIRDRMTEWDTDCFHDIDDEMDETQNRVFGKVIVVWALDAILKDDT